MKPKHSQSRNGDMAEYYAVTWLWDNGYEVFTNAGCTGMVDMIAMDKEGNTIKIDVKSDTWSERQQKKVHKHGRTDEQKQQGVQIVSYNPDTRKLRFVEHRE